MPRQDYLSDPNFTSQEPKSIKKIHFWTLFACFCPFLEVFLEVKLKKNMPNSALHRALLVPMGPKPEKFAHIEA